MRGAQPASTAAPLRGRPWSGRITAAEKAFEGCVYLLVSRSCVSTSRAFEGFEHARSRAAQKNFGPILIAHQLSSFCILLRWCQLVPLRPSRRRSPLLQA